MHLYSELLLIAATIKPIYLGSLRSYKFLNLFL